MKLKNYLLFGVALLLFVLPNCTGTPPVTEPSSEKYVLFQEVGYSWVVIITEINYLPNNPEGAVIKIRNSLDRSLTLDFDGPSHYTISIGDRKTKTIRIQEGSYQIMASAPGLSYVPKNRKYFFKDRYVYKQEWDREKTQVNY
jgi:hypothetical protein